MHNAGTLLVVYTSYAGLFSVVYNAGTLSVVYTYIYDAGMLSEVYAYDAGMF